MIVVDASAWVTALSGTGPAGIAAREALGADHVWSAPSHMPIEALRTLARLERAGLLSKEAVDERAALVIRTPVRYAVHDAATAAWVWTHRHRLSAYDAPYVHLASRLDVPLVTVDSRMATVARALGVTTVVPA